MVAAGRAPRPSNLALSFVPGFGWPGRFDLAREWLCLGESGARFGVLRCSDYTQVFHFLMICIIKGGAD